MSARRTFGTVASALVVSITLLLPAVAGSSTAPSAMKLMAGAEKDNLAHLAVSMTMTPEGVGGSANSFDKPWQNNEGYVEASGDKSPFTDHPGPWSIDVIYAM